MAILMMILVYFFFVLYYFLTLRLLRFRFFKFYPKLVTSYRAHGKWGDLIVCLVPISWCLNIITNSNLLLRILEWQGETGLLTIRVRGKQWYWVYKFEVKSFLDILHTSKEISYNRHFLKNYMKIERASLYMFFLNKRNSYDNLRLHWSQYFFNNTYNYNLNYVSFYNSKTSNSIFDNYLNFSLINENKKINPKWLDFKNNPLFDFTGFWLRYRWFKYAVFWNSCFALDTSTLLYNAQHRKYYLNFFSSIYLNKNIYTFLTSDFVENFRHVKAHQFYTDKIFFFNKNSYLTDNPIKLTILQTNKNSTVKDNLLLYFLVIKQKRFTPKKIKLTAKIDSFEKVHFLINFQKSFFYQNTHTLVHNYLIKFLRNYDNLYNLTLNKRLLRTKRLLVLPAHFNISVITNSFDVVHSWYIPGLGIKLDCVPGRSTHHNIYIPSFGFYYGQCAEICGRYHHHMPIRVCALPFEHFLIWWYNYSVNVYLSFTKKRLSYTKLALRCYTW